MDRFTGLEVFVRVVELGGLTAAADDRAMSPTMVAKHLRAIETRLGAKLFVRTTRRQSLTDAGRIYYAECRELLERLRAADESVSVLQSTVSGTLRIFAPVTFGSFGLTPRLAEYLARHPDLKVDLTLSDRPADLIDEGYDAAFSIGPEEDSRYVVRPLRPYVMAMGAAPAYLGTRGTPLRPTDLVSHNCLGFSYWARQDAWRLLGPNGEELAPILGNFRVNNGPALLQAALAGLGIVLQPEVLLSESFARGGLIRLLTEYAAPAREMSLLYVPQRRTTPKLRSFIDFTLAAFGPEACVQ